MSAIPPFSGMQNYVEVFNELGGQCWPQHQLTPILIITLIRTAADERSCIPENVCPIETRKVDFKIEDMF